LIPPPDRSEANKGRKGTQKGIVPTTHRATPSFNLLARECRRIQIPAAAAFKLRAADGQTPGCKAGFPFLIIRRNTGDLRGAVIGVFGGLWGVGGGPPVDGLLVADQRFDDET